MTWFLAWPDVSLEAHIAKGNTQLGGCYSSLAKLHPRWPMPADEAYAGGYGPVVHSQVVLGCVPGAGVAVHAPISPELYFASLDRQYIEVIHWPIELTMIF